MKLFVAFFAVIAVAAAVDVPTNDYLPPAETVAFEQVAVEPQEAAVLADDGYRYKTVRRLKYRHRRDVNELVSNEYLPPAASAPVAVAEQQVFVEPQESAVLADDGYRYKAVRRLKYRHRRDVNELPSNEYLPPAASAPVAVVEQQVYAAPQESAVLADDGYRYKAVRRLKYRPRRDVNELPSNDYLPPAASAPVAVAEEQVYFAPQESAVLADDGYRYKAVRRLKYRPRRDVNELPSNDYLPPAASAPVAVAEEQVYFAPQESAVLADDGYRYKAVRRLKYRHRRDVNELPSNDYLPPAASAPVAVAEEQVYFAPQESAVLADDGYRYKAVRRLKYRHRRDVNEIPSNDYLPPAASAPVAVAEEQVYLAPQESAVLADDGYRYKAVRRLKYRHRRDVNELPSNDYLPPAASAPVAVVEEQVYAAPQEATVLADDGYRYKTVRRLKYRQRRV
ncbi:PREDICTED: uncharacterized protein LOC108363764 [Rhagoletis zephyria]|uniref:uncharacterized protein LOC108363764 n=1 Tax=Rhagoletis zephyria TaxID=28612 RepID=UPI0008112EBE|nr:PREDICTED: uncharacterized protein LOC108363764 [Rhagoletis zephyria]